MAYVRASLVLETTTTTGTGTLTLAGAKDAAWLTFAAAVGEGNTCSYSIVASDGQRETGVGTVVGSTLERTALVASSTGSKLVLPAGTHEVGVTANSTSFSEGMGEAAYLNVGTIAGTVAAGDDSRFTAITAVGSGVNFFPTDTAIIAAGVNNTYPVKTLSNAPSGATEDVDSIVIGAGATVMYGTYLSPVLLNTQLDAGIWEFHVYAGVDSATGTTTLIQNIYRVRPASGTVTITGTGTARTATASTGTPFATAVIDASASIDACSFVQTPLGLYPITGRTSDTVVTITTPSGYTNESTVAFSVHKKLFGVTSGEINNLAGAGPGYTGIVLLPEMQSVQADIPLVAGDRLATAFMGTSTSARTLYFSHDGTTRYSHFHSPLEFVVDLTSGVSGVLPVANGGTGSTTQVLQESVSKAVSQTAHGFTAIGTPVYSADGVAWDVAAASTSATIHLGVVSAIADVDHFTLQQSGWITGIDFVTLTAGQFYYLTDAGSLSTTPGTINAPVLFATGSASGIILPFRAFDAAGSTDPATIIQAQLLAATIFGAL